MGLAKYALLPFGPPGWALFSWVAHREQQDEKRRKETVYNSLRYQPPFNLYGNQSWATDSQLGLHLQPFGVAVGETLSGKTIYSGLNSPHVTSVGATSQWKTSSLITAIVDNSLRDSSLNVTSDVAGELTCTTATFRRGRGEVHLIDPYELCTRYVRGYAKRGFYNALDLRFLNPLSAYFFSRAALIASL